MALTQYLHDHGFVAFLDRVGQDRGVGLPTVLLGALLSEDVLRDDQQLTGPGS